MKAPDIFPCGHPYSAMRSVLDMQCGICHPAAKVFDCGHPRTPENTGSGGPGKVRCRECRKKPTGIGRLSLREVNQGTRWNRQLEAASRSLLTAIYREHPYVIAAAIKSGRIRADAHQPHA